MRRQYANFCALTELYRGHLDVDLQQVFRAVLALRSLIKDQIDLEHPEQLGRATKLPVRASLESARSLLLKVVSELLLFSHMTTSPSNTRSRPPSR
jgi:hypothetical protein